MTTLPDVLAPGLKVIFCCGSGDALSERFRSTLHEIGLTPRALGPGELAALPDHGLGVTCLGEAVDHEPLTPAERLAFLERMLDLSPRVIAFVGPGPARAYYGVPVGLGHHHCEQIGTSAVFVLPSTAPRDRHVWEPSYWEAFGDFVRHLK